MDFAVRNRPSLCNAYETFGECMNVDCHYSHDCWPYKTHKLHATISSDTTDIFGSVRFILTERDGSTQDEFYIPKHSWYSRRAGAGDEVELQVSEKVHRLSGHNIGRVVRILTPAQVLNDGIGRSKRNIGEHDCFAFFTFNDCKFGEKCKRVHRCEADQFIELGEIASFMPCLQGSKAVLKLARARDFVEKTYLVPNGPWYTQGANEGDLVIFQESSQQYYDSGKSTPISYAKILTVLPSYTDLVSMLNIPVERRLKHAFTLDPPRTQTRVGVCSIEKCKEHENNCKVIGVHKLGVALTAEYNKKLGKDFIHKHRQSGSVRNFFLDTIQLSISVYAHTESDRVDGPLISSVFVDEDNAFTYGELEKYSERLNLIWSRFVSKTFIEVSAKLWLPSLILEYPDTWKERFTVHQMKEFFDVHTTTWLKSKRGYFVVAQNFDSLVESSRDEILIPATFLNDLGGSLKLSKTERELKIAELFGSINQAGNVFLEDSYLPDIFRRDVVLCEQTPENKIVRSTAPAKRTLDLLNQQIILNCMLGRSKPMYSKEEIYGIIADRYETPNICKSVVRDLHNKSVTLQITGTQTRWRRSYHKFKLKHLLLVQLGDECTCIDIKPDKYEFRRQNATEADIEALHPVESISVLLKGVQSTEYCNTNLAKISGDTINKLRTEVMKSGVESETVKDIINDLTHNRTEEFAPYTSVEDGTKITLKRGIELQLQISLSTGFVGELHHNLRLLRIGKNLHLCLAHLNCIKRAFLGHREDVREFVTRDMLKKMKNDIDENTLETTTLNGIFIQWKNDYFYGGTFHTKRTISVSNLLCIRKEICHDDEVSFVWTCHGVVSKISGSAVDFLVCSLSQDEWIDMSESSLSSGYIVEIITVESD